MSNYLDVYVRDVLKRIPGVADVMIFGERKYSMRLWLDPVRMAGRGLTAPDVVNALVGAERGSRRRTGWPAAGDARAAVSGQRAGGGPAERAGAVRQHYSQDECRWHAGPTERRGAGRTWARRAMLPICNSTGRTRWESA